MNNFIQKLEERLRLSLPGAEAQKTMSPSVRLPAFLTKRKKKPARESSVLILIYPKEQELYTVFIRRPEYRGPHSGEIALPGGKKEPQDSNPGETALREAEEEIGVRKIDVRLLGELTLLYIPFSNMDVHPFIGYIDYCPEFLANPGEVKEIIEFPLMNLDNPEYRKWKKMRFLRIGIDVPYFDVNGHHVWGATGMICGEFSALLHEIKK